MMERTLVVDDLLSFFSTEFPDAGELDSPDTDLLAQHLVDSIGIINTSMFLENHFGIEITEADLNVDVFRNVASLSDFVLRRLAA